jgi:hypothetical protein
VTETAAVAKERLDLHLDRAGEWLSGQPTHLKSSKAVRLGGAGLRIVAAECSGATLISGAGSPILGLRPPIVGSSDAELYVKLTYAGGGFEYVPAPVTAPLEFKAVDELELSILCVVGHQACTSVHYRAFFSAHCVFERL